MSPLRIVRSTVAHEAWSICRLGMSAAAPTGPPMMVPATADKPFPPTGSVLRIEEDGTVTDFSPLWEIERDEDPAGGETDNHPYGLLAGPAAGRRGTAPALWGDVVFH